MKRFSAFLFLAIACVTPQATVVPDEKPAETGPIRLTVVATNNRDTALVARLRGLGFGGIMTLGDHHAPHHLAMAKGQ